MKYKQLRKLGWEWMEKSRDGSHDVGHIKRMLADLEKLLRNEKSLKKKIDREMVELMIAWHDCWKAEKNLKNIFWLVWANFYEGFGSAKIFGKEARKVGLGEENIKKVSDGIKIHPWIFRKAKRSLEAKVLWDLDNLETWNLKRIKLKKRRFEEWITLFYIKNFLMKRSEKYIYFDWSRKEYVKRKNRVKIKYGATETN